MPGQWANSTRRQRLPADWHARRARTKRLAGQRCQHVDPDGARCGWTSPPRGAGQPDGHADHIDRIAGDEQWNLQWLCPAHHRAKTTLEGSAALPRERRPAQQHPGLT